MRARALLAVAALAGGLFATATPAAGATQSCQLTVTGFYYSIGLQTASASLSGCGSERISGIEMECSCGDGPGRW